MEKNRICRICSRRFANGKAMGGHMRSHLAKLPLPPKPFQSSPKSPPPSSSSSSFYYPSTNNPMRSVNHELAFNPPNDDYGESDTDQSSPKNNNPTRKRSKRLPKSTDNNKVVESVVKSSESPEQVSCVTSNIFNDDDVALCLLMLSRDKRKITSKVGYTEDNDDDVTDRPYINGDEDADLKGDDEALEEEDESFGEICIRSNKSPGKYRCQTCNKRFRSYQALGGHKASHKKSKTTHYVEGSRNCNTSTNVKTSVVIMEKNRIFKCPFCEKVFDSGQALGGHKKVHFSYLGNHANSNNSNNNNIKFSVKSMLDLNLPAPEDDGELSQDSRSYYSRA